MRVRVGTCYRSCRPARSSVGERSPHTREVAACKPAAPTRTWPARNGADRRPMGAIARLRCGCDSTPAEITTENRLVMCAPLPASLGRRGGAGMAPGRRPHGSRHDHPAPERAIHGADRPTSAPAGDARPARSTRAGEAERAIAEAALDAGAAARPRGCTLGEYLAAWAECHAAYVRRDRQPTGTGQGYRPVRAARTRSRGCRSASSAASTISGATTRCSPSPTVARAVGRSATGRCSGVDQTLRAAIHAALARRPDITHDPLPAQRVRGARAASGRGRTPSTFGGCSRSCACMIPI